MANRTGLHDLGDDIYDTVFTCVSVSVGLPANILIFLAFRSYPAGASKLLFQLLAVFDAVSLLLLFSQRPLMWWDILVWVNKRTTTVLTVYLNIISYISIFTNIILVFLTLERLLYVRFPSSHAQYYVPQDRVKLTLFIVGLLIMSFCLIITIKMSYFGIAWVVVFMTFYVVSPSFCLLACVVLLALRYYKKYKDRKYFEQNKILSGSHSHSSFVEKSSSSRHSGLSASGPFKGSTSSGLAFKGKKKDPYSLFLAEKSASESHLAIRTNPMMHHQNGLPKSISGNCVNTVVTLKVPKSGSYNLATHKVTDKEELLTQEEEEYLLRKKTRNTQLTLMAVVAATFVILSTVPLMACTALVMTEDKKQVDLSDKYSYLLVLGTMLSMYIIHTSKFFMYAVASSIFRRHVAAVFTCSQKALAEEEAGPRQYGA